jgi:hypothetical protein
MRPGIDFQKADFNGPFYDLMVSPLKAGVQPSFLEIGYKFVNDWEKRVQDGRVEPVLFADGSSLYLQSDMTKDDKDYLIQNFWAQRWVRWGWLGGRWSLVALGPALALLIFGRALLWVGRGFADDSKRSASESA